MKLMVRMFSLQLEPTETRINVCLREWHDEHQPEDPTAPEGFLRSYADLSALKQRIVAAGFSEGLQAEMLELAELVNATPSRALSIRSYTFEFTPERLQIFGFPRLAEMARL